MEWSRHVATVQWKFRLLPAVEIAYTWPINFIQKKSGIDLYSARVYGVVATCGDCTVEIPAAAGR